MKGKDKIVLANLGELAVWRVAALGLLALSVAVSLTQYAAVWRANQTAAEWERRYHIAVSLEHDAVQAYGELLGQVTAEREARAEQAAAYEAAAVYQYVGSCTVTYYCCEPYAHICGTGDGITATGLPVTPGIVAVDPDVIPLGSTVVIDGQRYLAADTGVTGLHVDIAVATHEEAAELGVRAADVWIVAPEGGEQDG